jgi:hypothetical protein
MNESTVNFPVTVVDVALRVNRLGIDFSSGTGSNIPGLHIEGVFASNCGVGISLD